MATTITAIPERTYNVPLRKQYQKAPNWKRTERAVNGLKAFLKRHLKSENIKIGTKLNEELWKHGIKNPPHHVKIIASRDEKGVVKAELFGVNK
ncbi:60S ribosomal protein L31 [Candidatus Woesearchaeota archaeon]|nr:60S ribosomal protein L31 [Candidatus Woesearchaeota archaeon]